VKYLPERPNLLTVKEKSRCLKIYRSTKQRTRVIFPSNQPKQDLNKYVLWIWICFIVNVHSMFILKFKEISMRVSTLSDSAFKTQIGVHCKQHYAVIFLNVYMEDIIWGFSVYFILWGICVHIMVGFVGQTGTNVFCKYVSHELNSHSFESMSN
jgi:hypothetical protein